MMMEGASDLLYLRFIQWGIWVLKRRYAPQWAFGDTVAQKSHYAPYACAFSYHFGASKYLWWEGGVRGEAADTP